VQRPSSRCLGHSIVSVSLQGPTTPVAGLVEMPNPPTLRRAPVRDEGDVVVAARPDGTGGGRVELGEKRPMRAVRLHRYHEDPSIDEIPEPRITGPLDVVVRIGGAGVCRTDLHIVEGQWEAVQHPRLPYVLGHENAGWVHAVGDGVTNVAVGDTVILHPQPSCGLCLACRAGDDMHCANAFFPGLSDNDGGMAEYLRTSARACVKLDPETDPADVAALADAGITAYHAVRKAVPLLPPGTTAVVQGAGGLGHIGIQCLRALTAARIVVVDRNADALALAEQIGADETVLADGDHVESVRDLTGGTGAHVVFDYVAEQGAEMDGWNMTAPGGSCFVIGYGGELSIPTLDIISTERNIVGNIVGTYADLTELMVLAQAGRVTLHTQKYPLDEAVDALHDLDAGKVRGRAILVP
jgi:NAD+-dependent secondary alcohol dehydrogenase Adh1